MDSVSREKNQHLKPKPGSAAAIAEAQQMIRKYIPAGVLLSEELIEDRRREAAGE